MESNSVILKTILDKINNLDKKLIDINKNIKLLKDDRAEFKKYSLIESKLYEKEITSWLYNNFINLHQSMFFYIPDEKEIPIEILKFINIKNISKKPNTLTDLDGIIIETNNFNEKNKCELFQINNSFHNEISTKLNYTKCINQINESQNKKENFIYKLHIIESKHNLDIKKIKKKLRQILILKDIIDNEESPENFKKFKNSEIYLYFATPTLNKGVYDFIKNNTYKEEVQWKNNREKFNLNKLNFIDNNIKFITYGKYDYYIT